MLFTIETRFGVWVRRCLGVTRALGVGVCGVTAVCAGEVGGGGAAASAGDSVAGMGTGRRVDLWTGEGVVVAGVLFPHVHFQSVYGATTLEGGHEVAAGHHDPVEDGWTVQGVEVGMSARVGEYFEAFGVYHGYWENEDPNDYGDEFEEWFGKLKSLPGGFEVRGGRYLNRFGLHNAQHLHAWDWFDNFLVSGRLMGDDGLSTVGGELSWTVPMPWTSVVSVSVGEAQREGHDHGEEEEGHEHAAIFEGEGAAFDDVVTVADWTNVWTLNDFHQFRGGVAGAWGDNGWGRLTQVYGANFQYEWRQNGLEPGGAYFRWRTEVMVRSFEALSGPLPGESGHGESHAEEDHADHGDHEEDHDDEAGVSGDIDDWGWYTTLSYGRPLKRGVLEAALRFDWVSDRPEAGLSGRWRLSPGLSWYANDQRTAFVRVQYNHDWIDGEGSGDAVWAGFGFNWGGPEVR